MSFHTRLLRREFTGNISLKTTDHCRNASFLAKFSPRTPIAVLQSKKYVNGKFLLELSKVLFSHECAEIIRNANRYIFENISDKYRFGKQRKSSRLLALDKALAENLWEIVKDVLSQEMEAVDMAKLPRGFDVTRGEWELHGLNEGMRINKYSGRKKEYFGPHKDAQYCPNGDERSIFTCLVYLNDDFNGGETCFYFPKNSMQSTKGTTIEEEINSHGSLEEGYDCVKILPKVGHVVISSQDILHQSLPVVKGTKYILKTDVVVKRQSKQFGFAVAENEKQDYVQCLDFFREAQQEELQGNFDTASDLYEKALSIRYCYPQCLEERREHIAHDQVGVDIFSVLPYEVWYHVVKYLSGYDAQHLVYAYPELSCVKASWEQHRRNIASSLSNEKFFPKIEYQKGVVTCFEFPDVEFFRENMTACFRVAAVYSFFLLSHKPQDSVYTVEYNPNSQDICVVALETLLADVFYSRKCYGSFYNVRQQDHEKKNPKKDFEASVDRNYMLMQHRAEFTGVELPDSFYVKSAVFMSGFNSDEVMDESSSEDEYKGDVDDSSSENEDGSEKECGDDVKSGDSSENEHSVEYNDSEDGTDDVTDGSENNKKAKQADHNGVMYDGRLQRLFEKDIRVDSLLRYLLLSEDAFRTDLSSYRGRALRDATVGHNRVDEVSTYFNCLNAISGQAHASATRVSKLKGSLIFDSSQLQDDVVCVCNLGPSRTAMGYVYQNCTTEFFNHLVFDFQTTQLNVKHLDVNETEEFEKSYRRLLSSHLLDDMSYESIVCVSMEKLLTSDTSFNHAACQCGFPRFTVHEYYNLKDYPSIDSVYIIAKAMSEKMLVWTVYKGVVAL